MDATFSDSSLPVRMERTREVVTKRLERFWQEQTHLLTHRDIEKLHLAMAYALQGGKRLRAFLVAEGVHLAMEQMITKQQEEILTEVMLAIEMLHAYSLVHDDLPAMDDSDLRRGRATLHIAYDEATAVLVGDALLTSVFEILSAVSLEPHIVVKIIRLFATHSGRLGMIAGQIMDMTLEKEKMNLQDLRMMQSLKTGELFSCALQSGVVLFGEKENFDHSQHGKINRQKLMGQIGKELGKLFQIVDDMLDVEGDEHLTGKKTGSDKGKITWYAFMNKENMQQEIEKTVQTIIHLARYLPKNKQNDLILFAEHLSTRRH